MTAYAATFWRNTDPRTLSLDAGPDAGLGLVVGRVLRLVDLCCVYNWFQLCYWSLLRRVSGRFQ